ncbi:unnamed protein product, partial [Ectocarpus fasciculatus]
QKPEHVLKRVNGMSPVKEKKFGLEQLHNVVSNSKRKQWQKIYEQVMVRHLELCVDLKDARLAKDGLHQYRNMVVNLDPQSLEVVIVHLVDLAEARASAAKKRADNVALAAAAKISDLDQEETPESLMLSTMTEDGAKERTDKEVVVPWVKFLWEVYRAVLELLHKNAKLDKVYHKTCEKAFRFCQEYNRKFEFRKLCDTLRMQLNNVQKLTGQSNRQNKPVWEWTTESVELYLMTRFSQLEVSMNLELWNEGFKTVEEIYSIMQLSKRAPKPRLMSIYYEKLTRIFWVSGNHLFHAYAWYRYYSLCCECRKDMKAEERTSQANTVLLATLCIPEDGATTSAGPAGVSRSTEDGSVPDKNRQMAILLDFAAQPTRQALLTDIVAGGILDDVSPSIRSMYTLLEGSFRPLSLVKELVPVLTSLSQSSTQAMYGDQLKRVIVIRGVQQLSKVYSTVKIDFLKKLLADLNMPFFEIERLLVGAITRKQVQLRIDHSAGCLKFGSEVSAGAAIDDHLTQLGNNLKQFMTESVPAAQESEARKLESRREYLQNVASAVRDGAYSASGLSLADRKMLIERRKEERERLQQDRLRDEDMRRQNEEQKRLEEEQRRLQAEEEARNQAKLAKLQFQLNVTKTKNALAALGKVVEESVLLELDDASLQKMLLETQLESQRAKEEETKKVAEAAKKLDYSVRAVRIECAPLVKAKVAEILENDRALYDERMAAARAAHRENYDFALATKARLYSRMQAFSKSFEDSLLGNQKQVYEKQAAVLRKRAIAELRDRRVADARDRKRAEDARIAAEEEEAREKAQKEESDRLLAEQHEQLRRTRDAELEAEQERERLAEEERVESEKKREAAEVAPAEREMWRGAAQGRGGDGDRDRGFGGDRERNFGGDRDRGFGIRDQGSFGGDRERNFGDRERGFGGDRDRGFGGDRERNFGDRDNRGFGGERERGFGGERPDQDADSG